MIAAAWVLLAVFYAGVLLLLGYLGLLFTETISGALDRHNACRGLHDPARDDDGSRVPR